MPPSSQSSVPHTVTLDWTASISAEPEPLRFGIGMLTKVVGPLLSVAIFIAAVWQFRALDWAQLSRVLPASPAFWLVFAGWYLAAPLADWIIFRRLWAIPLSGMLPLIGKGIGNDLLMGYVGEVYFYDWARRHAKLTTSPFGAVKDVAILSAIAGNAATLAMVLAAWPFANLLPLSGHGHELAISIVVVLGTSALVMLFRGRLFSLPRAELRMIFGMQMLRIAVTTGLSALLWHIALPQVELTMWLLLATIRLLISRLPFLPNKDVVFAGLAVVLVGHELDIAALMAMLAGVILTTHLVLGTGLLAAHAAQGGRAQ